MTQQVITTATGLSAIITDDREHPLTDAEFKALPRDALGDILDLELAYPWITAEQRDQLTGDDYTRMDVLDEEMAYLMAEARREFGL